MENGLSITTGDAQLDKDIGTWLAYDKVKALVQEGAVDQLRRCFSSRMVFGTAGLRAAMGPGVSCMNDLTIIQTTQGFCRYLEQCFSDLKERGVVIGFDARAHPASGGSSKHFASLAAAAFTSQGVPVHLFSDITPTPFVPFAVSHLGLCAGVMVTASHNPKEDNGYKVYWSNGAQIVSPHDKGIARAIEENLEPWAQAWDTEAALKSSLLQDPYQDVHTHYFMAIQQHCHHRDGNKRSEVKTVHTSVHGVGHTFVQAAFKAFDLRPPFAVEEQKDPDPEFPTVNGQWRVLTGNELGALLGWWMFRCWKEQNPDPAAVKSIYMLASTVSSKILRAIALKEGFHFEETLTGFKWMGNRARDLMNDGKYVLFAFEEAIDLSLSQKLTSIYEEYGYHISKNSYFICHDQDVICSLFQRLRNHGDRKDTYPTECGGFSITSVRDLTTGYDSNQPDKKAVLPTSSSSQMITFSFSNGCVATMRTSGTEPKIKYYTELCAAPGNSDVAQLQKELDNLVDAIVENFFEPEKNKLQPKPVTHVEETGSSIITMMLLPVSSTWALPTSSIITMPAAPMWRRRAAASSPCRQRPCGGDGQQHHHHAGSAHVEETGSSIITMPAAPISKDFSPRPGMKMGESTADEAEEQEVVHYRLTLVGSLPVHPLTTMAMLPWVVAEVADDGQRGLPKRSQCVFLSVSASRVQCVSAWAEGAAWDPLSHTVLFECRPHRVTKLIHNSQEPSSFGCLVRDTKHSACYVFQCHDSNKELVDVPEIISTLRQAGKSAARSDDVTPTTDVYPPTSSRGLATARSCPAFSTVSSTTMTSTEVVAAGPATIPATFSVSGPPMSPTAFAKKFEVLFCGRVTVAHKKAPPALIDECIEKFGQSRGSGDGPSAGRVLVGRPRRSLSFHANGLAGDSDGLAESPTVARRPLMYTKDPGFPCLQALDENGLSPEITLCHADDAHCHSTGVRPTSLQENRTMLFMVGRAQIFLVSPDTKKVAIEKSFKEISFCSQGIHHVDHFGFICRETVDGASCQFVCYVFQCTDESLVDEIMLTLKQAFSVAAQQQSVRTQSQQCDSCPMQQLHRLCERIEGLQPSKTKLELQKHLATLDNEDQANRAKSEQEENELVMASLRSLYEDRQKDHQHTQPGERKQVCDDPTPAEVQQQQQQSSSRQRLEEFKTRAKRSLTESLEGIWKASRKPAQRENSTGSDGFSSSSTINNITPEQCYIEDPLHISSPRQPTSSLRGHNSAGDLKSLDPSPSSSPCSSSPCSSSPLFSFTYSHPPTPSSSDTSPCHTDPLVPQDLTPVSKPKLVRHYSVRGLNRR
ncbi:hypothetical protein NHX12_018890, partial [Muraenolepis orangiensis]